MLSPRCETGAVNVDDAYAKRIMEQADCRLLTYSAQGNLASLMAEHVELFSDRVEFDAVYQNKRASVTLGIPGIFSVYNALGVIAAALALNIPLQKRCGRLRTSSVKGRVEVVPTPGKDYTVLIDYSHTPDSLENILKAVRGFCTGRVIAVFGCGGDRDPYKRPVMGKIAAELSDLAIVTSDNPRTEDPAGMILRQILAGMQDTETPYEVIESRVSAIGRAMELARKNDVIVLCGKDMETYQEIGHENFHLDERGGRCVVFE